MCLSGDGELLYSAGTDGIVKAASMESGSVVGKVAIPLRVYVIWTSCNITTPDLTHGLFIDPTPTSPQSSTHSPRNPFF